MALPVNFSLHNIVRIIVTKPIKLQGTNSNTNNIIIEGKDGTRSTICVFSKISDDFEVINLVDKKAPGQEDVNHENS